MMNQIYYFILLLIFFLGCSLDSLQNQWVSDIKNAPLIEDVKEEAFQVIENGFNAGDNYGEVRIHYYHKPFIELASEVHGHKDIEMFEKRANEFGKTDWRDLISVEDLWHYYPEKLRHIFASLDLSSPEMYHVRSALSSADTIAAGKALIEYYKNGNHWLTENIGRFTHQDERQKAMELLSDDKLTLRDVTIEIPENEEGGWQWNYTGPANDDEFGYELNRHLYFSLLLKGWNETGNDKFAQKFDTIIRDWTIHNSIP